jgi:hypothetical protein
VVRKAAPKPDWGKIAQAARGRVLAPPVRKAPTRVAFDKGLVRAAASPACAGAITIAL